MSLRVDYPSFTEGINAMYGLEKAVRRSGLEKSLLELVKVRASQINGCAYCIDMHTKDALAQGETPQRLFALSAWHETQFFTERERAALTFTEAVTLVAETHVPDEVVEEAKRCFTDDEVVKLVYAVVVINAWNRLGVSVAPQVGVYQPGTVPSS